MFIDCGYTLEPLRRGGSNEYPQSMFWSKNKKNRYIPSKPQFCYIQVGLRGYIFHGHVLLMQFLTQIIAQNQRLKRELFTYLRVFFFDYHNYKFVVVNAYPVNSISSLQ